jgi:hypothetical protein
MSRALSKVRAVVAAAAPVLGVLGVAAFVAATPSFDNCFDVGF